MSKSDYSVKRVNKNQCFDILNSWHYLSDESKGFKSGYNYGLFHFDALIGVCIFTGFPVPELAVGCYGLEKNDQDGLFELSRLCVNPHYQSFEHNITSWFVSRSIKTLRKQTDVRSILSYADDNHHKGTIYRACNFKYFGTSTPKKDFWIRKTDGSYIKHSRGKVKGLDGEWRPRSVKHRFLMTFDNKLKVQWASQI